MTAWAYKRFGQQDALKNELTSPSSDLLPGLLVAKIDERPESTEYRLP